MKASMFKKIISIFLVVVMAVSFFACSANPSESGGDGTEDTGKKNNNTQTNTTITAKSEWDLYLNGNKVNLPCTLEDLNKAGVEIYSDVEKQSILESENKSFFLVTASCGDTYNFISLCIETGENSSKGAANAIVNVIVNKDTNGSAFKMKGDICIGSSADDVIKTFGDDYKVTGTEGDDIRTGYKSVLYGTENDGALFLFEDGILAKVEIYAKEVK